MNVFCTICGHCWDSRDPGVRYLYGDCVWECADEGACFERKAMTDLDREAQEVTGDGR